MSRLIQRRRRAYCRESDGSSHGGYRATPGRFKGADGALCGSSRGVRAALAGAPKPSQYRHDIFKLLNYHTFDRLISTSTALEGNGPNVSRANSRGRHSDEGVDQARHLVDDDKDRLKIALCDINEAIVKAICVVAKRRERSIGLEPWQRPAASPNISPPVTPPTSFSLDKCRRILRQGHFESERASRSAQAFPASPPHSSQATKPAEGSWSESHLPEWVFLSTSWRAK